MRLGGCCSEAARRALGRRPTLSFDDVLARGAPVAAAFQPAALTGDDLATIIYTSGTSGHPKARLAPARRPAGLGCVHLAPTASCRRGVPALPGLSWA